MISSIHCLRGIASIMVFFAHYRTIPGLSSPLNDFFSMGAYGVDMFFVISGFVVCLMLDKLKILYETGFHIRFLLSRFVRVIVPLWGAMIMYYIVVGDYSGKDNLINSIFLIPTSNTYYDNLTVFYLEPQWSLLFESMFYIVLSAFIGFKHNFLYSAGTLFILCIAYFFGYDNYIANPIILEFIFGMLSYQIFLMRCVFVSKWVLFGPVLVFLIFSFLLRNQAGEIDSILRVLTVGVSCFFIIVTFSNNEGINLKMKEQKTLIFLGNVSYSVYLTHMIGFRIFEKYQPFYQDFSIYYRAIILFFVITSITLSFYFLFDKPCHHLSKMILKND